MRKSFAAVFLLCVCLSGSPASADGVPGAWLISSFGGVSIPSKLAMGSMKQCVKALRGKGQFHLALDLAEGKANTVWFYADGTKIPDGVKSDNMIHREWAYRGDHAGMVVVGLGHYECIRAK